MLSAKDKYLRFLSCSSNSPEQRQTGGIAQCEPTPQTTWDLVMVQVYEAEKKLAPAILGYISFPKYMSSKLGSFSGPRDRGLARGVIATRRAVLTIEAWARLRRPHWPSDQFVPMTRVTTAVQSGAPPNVRKFQRNTVDVVCAEADDALAQSS